MKKFGFLIGNFLKKRILSKGFIMINILFLIIAFLTAYFLGTIKGGIGKSNNSYNENFKTELVFSDDGFKNKDLKKYFYKIFNKSSFPSLTDDESLSISKNKILDSKIKIKEYFKSKNIELGIYFLKDGKSISSYLYLNNESSKIRDYAIRFINNFDAEIAGFNTNKKIDIISDINFNNIKNKQNISTIFLSILLALSITLIVQATQASSIDVVVEKSNRVIEQIILNVSEEKHLMSKVIGGILIAIIQILLIICFLFLAGFVLNRGIIDVIPYIVSDMGLFLPILFGVLFSIVGTFLFIIIFVYLAAISNGQEDFGTISGPFLGIIIFLLNIPLVLFRFKSIKIVHDIIMVFNYLPPFSIITSPALLISNEIMWYDALVSFLIIITLSTTIFYMLIPSYKMAILNYNSSNLKLFKRIAFYIKSARQRKKQIKENRK